MAANLPLVDPPGVADQPDVPHVDPPPQILGPQMVRMEDFIQFQRTQVIFQKKKLHDLLFPHVFFFLLALQGVNGFLLAIPIPEGSGLSLLSLAFSATRPCRATEPSRAEPPRNGLVPCLESRGHAR